MLRKVIRICAEDSPNVRLAREEIAKGQEPSGTMLIPGVITWEQYVHHRKVWDKQRQTIGLDALFPEGAGAWMFPLEWRIHSMRQARQLAERLAGIDYGNKGQNGKVGRSRKARAIGIDAAEGGDSTVSTVVDELGVLAQHAIKTPNTAVITGNTLALMREWDVPPGKTFFDRGGGGKEHADRLRAQGFNVRTVGFGEAPSSDPNRPGKTVPYGERVETKEERYVYLNRRVEMHHILRLMMEPGNQTDGFAIPAELTKLHEQMAIVPLMYDANGRMELPPKEELYPTGSPDELDSLIVACFALQAKPARTTAGAML